MEDRVTAAPHDTPDRLDPRSQDVAAERVARLREDFPDVFREGRIDFDALRRALGEWVDPGKERFGLSWPGKAECMRTIQQPSVGTLVPERAASVDFDTTANVMIEGENLEALKLLQKGYHGAVKLIYIDPPYNTGGEFIYPDNFHEGLRDYLRYSGQVDGAGLKRSTNTETGGRYHSRWLNMMYPRLYLARNLLREDGFIFVSIDDGEMSHARMMVDEIFGSENFIATAIWQKKYTRSNDAAFFSDNHEYILVFARNRDSARLNLQPRSEDQLAAYSNPDKHPKGPWKATPLHAKSGSNSKAYTFAKGVAWSPPPGTFRRYSDATMAEMEAGDEIWFGESRTATPSRKSFLCDVKAGVSPVTIWPYEEVGHTHEGNTDLKSTIGGGVFDNPKPIRLIARMLQLATDREQHDLVLDFFAGSGTTAHAVMQLNAEDGGNRRYILVQLPEPTDNAAFPTIADITRERVRRAGRKIAQERAGKLDLDGMRPPDLGFRAYRLADSNFKPWQGDPAQFAPDPHQAGLFGPVARQVDLFTDNLRDGRGPEAILTELLLKTGFPLTVPVVRLTLAGQEVFSVADGALLACLERSLRLATIETMAARDPAQIVVLDAGFGGDDRLKVNAVQTVRARARATGGSIVFQVV
ncbi:MAG: site-specific DNA-methyltransferase [Thermomicrobiales bacterium]|nr:site-specific DNA-methyltransferase [Thermomicrobiales bacterium]